MTDLLARIPAIDKFPTVDEIHEFTKRLAAENAKSVSLDVVGNSRDGDPIHLLTIRPKHSRGSVLVTGQPHPNEPIGMASVIVMCENLATDPALLEELGVTWYFVPCADPDGTRLNEGWFAGPWTREHYARHFYRPGSEQQVEWTFPFRIEDFVVDAPMPETNALMRAIDAAKPDVAASLHNAELGGAYFYAPEDAPPLYGELTALCERFGIPVHRGDPETPLSAELAPGVYSVPTAEAIYHLAKSIGADPARLISGASSLDYALQYKPTKPVVIELPYWRDPRAQDAGRDPSGRTRREVVLEGLDGQEADVARLRRILEASPLPSSPFADAVRSFLDLDESGWIEVQRQQARADEEFNRPVTVAEAFGVADSRNMSRLRLAGMLLRAIPAGTPTHEEAEQMFSQWAAEASVDAKAEVIPIRSLVSVQVGAILATVRHVLPG